MAKWLTLAVWTLLLGVGIVGIVQRLFFGHDLANYGSYVPWGLWVAGYVFFSGLSAGSFLIAGLFYGFGVEATRSVARPALIIAAVSLLCGLILIGLDLGHTMRFYRVFVSPNFSSMMAWMVWLYSAYLVLLAFMLASRLPERPGTPHHLTWLARIGMVVVLTFGGGVGALFATAAVRAYWHNPLFPVMFIVGAIVTATGLLLALSSSAFPTKPETERFLSRLLVSSLVLYVVFEWAEFSVGMWSRVGHEFEVMLLILFGPFWWVFWILHLGLGVVAPMLLLLRKNATRASRAVAGLLAAVMFFSVRLNIVIPGQVTPELRGIENSYQDARLTFHYVPSLHEWLVVAFVVAVGLGLAWFAFQRFLSPDQRPSRLLSQ